MKSKKKQEKDYIKANRRATREAEIERHGHPINYRKVQTSKKVYDRQKMKADVKRHLPSDFFRLVIKSERSIFENKNLLLYKVLLQ